MVRGSDMVLIYAFGVISSIDVGRVLYTLFLPPGVVLGNGQTYVTRSGRGLHQTFCEAVAATLPAPSLAPSRCTDSDESVVLAEK
jgi:hypothetical protein